jgi:hypothetical protein
MKGCNVSLLKDTMVQSYTFWNVYNNTNKVKGKCLCGLHQKIIKSTESKKKVEDTYEVRVEVWRKEGLMSFTN